MASRPWWTRYAASGSTASPTIEDEHAVPPPGPRGPGVVAPADFLVTLPDTADEELVKAVEGVRGITSVTIISLSEAVIENQALTVAAVDAGTYRTFVPQTSADFQEAWDRVAGGEVIADQQSRAGDDEFIAVGRGIDHRMRIVDAHVGAVIAPDKVSGFLVEGVEGR